MINKKDFLSGVCEKYDERLLEGRITIEGNLIACFAKDTTLLQDINLDSKKFITKDGKFYFGLINKLVGMGYNVIDEVTILSSVNDNIIEAFNERGGYETLSNMTEIINTSNFDTYLDNFYRSNLLCQLYSDGFELFNKITINDKQVVPFNLFQKMKPDQIIDFYDMRLSGYELGQSSEVIEEEDVFFEDGWENELADSSEVGVPYDICGIDIDGKPIKGFKYMSNQTMGLHPGNLMMLAGFSGVGKSTIFVTLIMALLYRGEKVIIISNEEKINAFKIKFMAFLLARHCKYYKCTKSKLSIGDLTSEDKAQIKIAKKYFNDNYKGCLKFVSINTNDMSVIKKKIRDAHLRYGFSAYLLDTFKASSDSFGGERQDLSLVEDSRELHALAMKYNMIGMCSAQCGERFKGALTLTANVLASSKQTKEILSQLFMCRTLYEEEKDPKSKYYCHPFRLENVGDKENPKWIETEYPLDESAVYIVIAIEKNRSGNSTEGNGVSHLLKFDGHLSTFREVCQVKTKHAIIQ